MKRIYQLQSNLLRVIDKYERLVDHRDSTVDWERLHLSSCGRLGYLLAEARGLDPVIAACACSVHDYGRILYGKQEGHAEAGYLPVKEFLKQAEFFTEEEIEAIALAVKNHSRKSEVGSPLEEIVKDADVIDLYQYGLPFQREEQKLRYERVAGSLSLK